VTKSRLALSDGVALQPTSVKGIARAIVDDADRRFELTWDRFCRINKTAEYIRKVANTDDTILDVGGFDGALALFLEEFAIDVMDPETTGGNGLDIAENSYDIVVSIDAVEHLKPADRERFINSKARAARKHCFVNFPAKRSAKAQALVYELTGNTLVHDHVRWILPDASEVANQLSDCGYKTMIIEHTSITQWISQYLLQTFNSESASKASRYLIENHLDESGAALLYDLVTATKIDLK
jgi:hypothetical protein